MSYTRIVKEEILQKEVKNKKDRDFELFSILKVKNAVSEEGIEFKLENISLAKRVYSYLKEHNNIRATVKYSISKRFGEHKVYSVLVPNQKALEGFYDEIKRFEKGYILKSEHKFNGYIRGMFLATGYIKHPDKEYALDFFIDSEKQARKLYEILKEKGKRAFITQKKNKFLVYLRNSEDIMDILVLSGAMKSFFEYEEMTMMKEIKNKTIRSINWEIANETKLINTASNQIEMLKYIEHEISLASLTGVLEETAYIRINNPEASLSEMGEIIGITKSGVRNRFRRIKKIYDELQEKDENK